MPTRVSGLLLAGALLLGACSDDDGSGATTSTSSLDPGVTFEEDITVPTDPSGRPTATTVPIDPGEVETLPREVPEQFPQNFPVPEGAVVEVGSVGHAEGELRVAVDYSLAGATPAEILDFYRQEIGERGWAVLLDESDGRGRQLIGQIVFETDTYIGNVLVSGDGANGVLLTLTATMPE
jgi:hypothetical protein